MLKMNNHSFNDNSWHYRLVAADSRLRAEELPVLILLEENLHSDPHHGNPVKLILKAHPRRFVLL
jgi:hypothetical protein